MILTHLFLQRNGASPSEVNSKNIRNLSSQSQDAFHAIHLFPYMLDISSQDRLVLEDGELQAMVGLKRPF